MNHLPTCTFRLVVQYPCQVSFKSMQGCRTSWEDKLKCVKFLSFKDHNSAKICWTWITSQHAHLDLWCNIPAKFHSNPCKDVGGVEKTNFDGMEGRKDGRTDKTNTKCPLAILWRGHKKAIFSTNVKVKVTRSLTLVSFERASLAKYECHIWRLYLLWLKSYSEHSSWQQTHRQTDRQTEQK